MGEFTKMNITTIKAKARLAALNLNGKLLSRQTTADIIEAAFVGNIQNINPVYAMSPFSGVLGCGIHKISDPQFIVCIVVPQKPFALDESPNAVSARALHRIDAVRIETERVCRLILNALNNA